MQSGSACSEDLERPNICLHYCTRGFSQLLILKLSSTNQRPTRFPARWNQYFLRSGLIHYHSSLFPSKPVTYTVSILNYSYKAHSLYSIAIQSELSSRNRSISFTAISFAGIANETAVKNLKCQTSN